MARGEGRKLMFSCFMWCLVELKLKEPKKKNRDHVCRQLRININQYDNRDDGKLP